MKTDVTCETVRSAWHQSFIFLPMWLTVNEWILLPFQQSYYKLIFDSTVLRKPDKWKCVSTVFLSINIHPLNSYIINKKTAFIKILQRIQTINYIKEQLQWKYEITKAKKPSEWWNIHQMNQSEISGTELFNVLDSLTNVTTNIHGVQIKTHDKHQD